VTFVSIFAAPDDFPSLDFSITAQALRCSPLVIFASYFSNYAIQTAAGTAGEYPSAELHGRIKKGSDGAWDIPPDET
jgi:hypothetical protein